jgi:hypothetical protein
MSPTGTGHVTIKPTAVGDMDNMIIGATTPLAGGFTTVKAATTIGVGNATPSASGAGITFPATQSASTDANTLDDYEEGTWTPTVTALTGSFTSYTSSGTYTKIGNVVHIRSKITITAIGTGLDGYQLSNLPFTGVTGQFCAMSGKNVSNDASYNPYMENTATTIRAFPVIMVNTHTYVTNGTYYTS